MKKEIKIEDGKLVKETVVLAILHGGLVKCNNKDFPAIFTRLTSPKLQKWIMNKAFSNETGSGKNLFH